MRETIQNFLHTSALNFRLVDLLDIALIAGLIYAALAWFRNRVSRVVSFGIVLVALVYALARYLNLYLTSMVFQVGLVAVILSLIVVFQEDIRRLFEQLRVLRPWQRNAHAPHQPAMDTLVEAVNQMARRHIGALIVLPGREALQVHLHGGIEAHAVISLPLLLSIFHTETAGHDGAVLIEDGRIERFGVHLPLSTRHEKLGPGGTRHAAALGLAERSDALVIVVSEERGTISVGREHELRLLASAAELGPMIEDFQAQGHSTRAARGPVRRLLGHNLRLKLTAMLLALGLWLLFAYRVENVQRIFEVPIEYRGLGEQWHVQEARPMSARVALTGSERALSALDPGVLRLSVDLSKLKEGSQYITLSDGQLSMPAGLKVVDITPRTLLLSAQKMAHVKLAVSPQLRGEPARGWAVSQVLTEPGRVPVQVPENLAGAIREIPTDPINIEGISRSTTVKARVLPGNNIHFLSDTPATVSVQVEVVPAATQR